MYLYSCDGLLSLWLHLCESEDAALTNKQGTEGAAGVGEAETGQGGVSPLWSSIA